VYGPNGVAFPGHATLAKTMGLTARSIITQLKSIESRGHIEIKPSRGRGKASEYRLKYEAHFTLSEPENVKLAAVKCEARLQKNVKPTSPQSVTEKQLDESILQNRFAEFWREYPRPANEPKARKAFALACKTTDPEIIIEATKIFALARDEWRRVRGAEYADQFTSDPHKWLEGKCWNDKPRLPSQENHARPHSAAIGAIAWLAKSDIGEEIE
jgi:hypothetical protein